MDNVHIHIAEASQEHDLQGEYSISDEEETRHTAEMTDFQCLKF